MQREGQTEPEPMPSPEREGIRLKSPRELPKRLLLLSTNTSSTQTLPRQLQHQDLIKIKMWHSEGFKRAGLSTHVPGGSLLNSLGTVMPS